MKKIKIISLVWAVAIAFVFVGCSPSDNQLKPLNIDSAVSMKNAIIIFNINFEDSYVDEELEKEKIVYSTDLLRDESLIQKNIASKEERRLRDPLYYIAMLKAEMESPDGDVDIERFSLPLESYEPVGLYAVKPGKYSLKDFKMVQYRYREKQNEIGGTRRHPFVVEHEEKIGTWNLEPGKIYYLGDLMMKFRTSKFMFGIYPREQVVGKIRLTKIELKDNIENITKKIKKDYSWFPVDKITNISFDKEWSYMSVEDRERVQKQERKKQKEVEKIKARKSRDKQKFFF